MRALPQTIGTLHFIGIGGIGMSGIAETLHALGYQVQGSDMADSANVLRLREKGIEIFSGHDAAHVADAALVVISSAVKETNPELKAAREMRLPVVRRAEMLAELMRLKWSIAVGGTHGKTTTTSMVGTVLEEAGFDPTVINGGIVNRYGTNTRLGQGDWMVVEADESDGTFTKLPAAIVIVTNIDPEHMEHYGSFAEVKAAYRRFVENVPFYGFAVICGDHPEALSVAASIRDRRVVTYGFNPQADLRAENLRQEEGRQIFDVVFSGLLTEEGESERLDAVALPMLGQHNVLNALSALAVAHEMGVPAAKMKHALAQFSGVKRRFTRTGESGGVTVIDDYGHHPVEIRAVLAAARQAVAASGGRVIAVMQPHRYTRLHDLFDDFCLSFNEADYVFIADVYAAGEEPIEGASGPALAEGVRGHGHKHAAALDHPEDLPHRIAEIARPGDYVICLGAGDITKWAYALPGQLDALKGKAA